MKRIIKNGVSILLLLTIIFSITISQFPVLAYDSSMEKTAIENDDVAWQSKIQPDLFDTADQKDGKYLVSIFGETVPDEEIQHTLLQKHGYEASVYESDLFYKQVLPKTLTDSWNSLPQALNRDTLLRDINSSAYTAVANIEMDRYIAAKRNVIREIYTVQNRSFIEKHISDPSNIVFCSQYAPYIVSYLTKDEIESLSKNSQVTHIMPEVIEPIQPAQSFAMPQVNVDTINGTKSSLYNNGQGFFGTGVKIGIVETGFCDITDVQLRTAYDEQRLILFDTIINNSPVQVSETEHATMVTSLIIGSSVVVNGETYSGVVPNATVYQTGVAMTNQFRYAIEQLLSYNVSVINLSICLKNSTKYESYDRYLDGLYQSQVTFVVSAGNEGNKALPCVTSPGKAYNAITVGNIVTKSSTNMGSSAPYSLYYSSSYSEDSFLTNKPDLVAPGTYIRFPSGDFNSGTSFSAPIVAGIVAQLHQANATLKTNPTLTKAVLLAGANFDSVSANNNELCELVSFVRDKSGVGMANAVNAMDIALASNYRSANFNLKFSSSLDEYLWTTSVSIPANTKIRIALTYNKPENILIDSTGYGNNVDLFFCDNDGNPLEYSFSYYNNVEVIEYTVTQAGTYKLTAMFFSSIPSETPLFINVSLAWRLTPIS